MDNDKKALTGYWNFYKKGCYYNKKFVTIKNH